MVNKKVIGHLNVRQVSYIEDKDKFFRLLDILGFALDTDVKNKIETLPYKIKIIEPIKGLMAKEINEHIYSMDEKTALRFRIYATLKSFTVPSNVERIANGALKRNKIRFRLSLRQYGVRYTYEAFHQQKT